jgi:uncharacterized protein (TIGR03086 family)
MSTEPSREEGPSVEQLAAAAEVTEGLIGGVTPDQLHLPTPCPDYDVTTLLDHLVGWARNFADKANGVTPPADPAHVDAGDDPRASFHEASARLVDGYRKGGSAEAPPLAVVLMETVTHGWDLAAATGQAAPYPADAVEAALVGGHAFLAPEFRGDGKSFGDEVEAAPDASALDRLVAFMGRDPSWSS